MANVATNTCDRCIHKVMCRFIDAKKKLEMQINQNLIPANNPDYPFTATLACNYFFDEEVLNVAKQLSDETHSQ